MTTDREARRFIISGVVQGVGFRPFLFQLAKKHRLTGEVWNTPQGVTLVAEGLPEILATLEEAIREGCPPLASVSEIRQEPLELKPFHTFSIKKSAVKDPSRKTLIPPDVSVCRDCLEEMLNPEDRRYHYPFINCTNCGPRYTIIRDVPYDRPKTSMAVFPMCPDCSREYTDPLDRRFHAQPNACPVCGPRAFLVDVSGTALDQEEKDAIAAAARLLREGAIVAVKGLGGFHLAVDACNPEAVKRLRERKNRPHKPFALMAASVDSILTHVNVLTQEKHLLESFHRPIVLLEKRADISTGEGRAIAPEVAPDNGYLGVMLPYTPLHYLLFENGPELLVMTSGNRSGEPLSIDNDDAIAAFSHIADAFLLHDRDIYFRADDSIVQVQDKTPLFLRRSRGYAPLPVSLSGSLPEILACGGGLKSTICLTRGRQAFLSQHIGDLDDSKSFAFFKDSIEHLKKILDIRPSLLVHDMHPGYMSTAWALEQEGIQRVAVQHHHAHAVACMAENGLREPVVAVTLDGTGYGTDGRIWGGEVLVCSESAFERKARLAYVAMPGGDAAVKEPWRMATALLYRVFGDDFRQLDIPFIRKQEENTLAFITRMIDRGINSPLTSSCGRLFDAVAALIGIRERISYESQAAMELQAAAGRAGESRYRVQLDAVVQTGNDRIYKIDMAPMVREIVSDIRKRIPEGIISRGFHRAIIDAFVEAASLIGKEAGIGTVVLSGGVFNNTIISGGIRQGLEHEGFRVYTHSRVPTGDGGISLGQAVAAGAMKRM